jgi:hypothetical protein
MESNFNIHGNCPKEWSKVSSSDAMNLLLEATESFCQQYGISGVSITNFNLKHASHTVDFYLDITDESFDASAYLNFLNACYNRCDFSIYEPERSSRPVTKRSRSKERQRRRRSRTPPRSRNANKATPSRRVVTSEVFTADY